MDDSIWKFPENYQDWATQGQQVLQESIENGTESQSTGLHSDDLLVNPVISESENRPRRKKKIRRPSVTHMEAFEDKYTLCAEILGYGAKSLVAVATKKNSQKTYAVKIIEKCEGYDRLRVLREVDLLHFLSECPNILQLCDSYEDNDRFFLVFERMEGGPLLKHIQHKKYFTEREASLVVKDIGTALKFLHDKGIAHRDLKPDNILCINKNSIIPVVICDFNLASGISMIGSATTPELYTPVGSAEYMAPEIVDAFVGDAPAYDKRCDLWSLGVILFIMLSGKPPFQGNCGKDCDWERGGSCRDCQSILWHNILDANFDYPEEEWCHVSMEARDLISHLLVKEASKRYTVENVLSHPWLQIASNNHLNTPDVLSSEVFAHRLSAVTSEAVAYRRIISERQNSTEDTHENHSIISRWSTPPKFGLSPPGNSRLAKRRSLKQKLSGLSLSDGIEPDESLATPVQSPHCRTQQFMERHMRPKNAIANSSPDYSSDNSTPVSTPLKDECPVKIF